MESKIAQWLYYFLTGSKITSLQFKEQWQKRLRMTPHEIPNGYAHPLWKIIIVSLNKLGLANKMLL